MEETKKKKLTKEEAIAVFMDIANDGGDGALEEITEIYVSFETDASGRPKQEAEVKESKKYLLQYKNQRAGSTALHLAANNGHVEVVEFLV